MRRERKNVFIKILSSAGERRRKELVEEGNHSETISISPR
jgi:hypothetical protein